MKSIEHRSFAFALAFLLMLTAPGWSQQPVIRQMSAAEQDANAAPGGRVQGEQTPLAQVLQWADIMRQRADQIDDYSCTFIKRERIGDQLSEHQQMQVRVRHRPLSLHVEFQAPASMRGRKAVWIEGQNNGNMLATGTGLQSLLGTMSLDPEGYLAMQGNLYPVTDIGIGKLADKMIRTTRSDAKLSDAKITFRQGAKVGDRPCLCIQFVYPVPVPGLRYHMSRMYVDEKLFLPIRFEGYSWPPARDGEPVLIEEYTYTNLKFHNGFTDRDFHL